MSSDGEIRVADVWKRFKSDRSRALLRDELQRLRARMGGDTATHWRWALRDVGFEIAAGEAVGLVGTNGSGKSTLLKILTQVMYPYAGSVEVNGRVGALIEVRAGIHPELTGRENTFLYGTLLGLTRTEVAQRFDAIVEFAELEQAVDRQVKFYSSGMQMRLGFAVAAFLEPDVLLVDEVLSVGDASFQQKCLDRMRQVLADGTTLVLVSHDLASVEAACARGIWLDQGSMLRDGPIRETLGAYRQAIEEVAHVQAHAGPIRVVKCEALGPDGGPPTSHERLDLSCVLEALEATAATVFLGVSEGTASPAFLVSHTVDLPVGPTEVRCSIDHLPLPGGRWYVWLGVDGPGGDNLLTWHSVVTVDVRGPELDLAPRAVVRSAPVQVEATWKTT